MTPKKLFIKDSLRSFEEGTIISSKTCMAVSFEELLNDLEDVRIIYVGEKHNEPAHHEIQLKIIKALFAKYPNISVGMEMFDRSYQPVLDMWQSGSLDEKTFLKKTHWYANWKFDFELYRDILEFIKEKKIRLAALNIPFHIPAKISVGGIENLLNDDKKYLPKTINTSDTAHRAYVEKIFKHHRIMGRDDFENFYMTQCVWEDVMAESVALNLKENKMIVLAGNGHIIQKFGIPNRAFQHTHVPFRTIFPISSEDTAELSFADYLWITPSD